MIIASQKEFCGSIPAAKTVIAVSRNEATGRSNRKPASLVSKNLPDAIQDGGVGCAPVRQTGHWEVGGGAPSRVSALKHEKVGSTS